MKSFQYKASHTGTFLVWNCRTEHCQQLLERTYNKKYFGIRNQAAYCKTVQEAPDVPLGSLVGGAFLAQAYRMLALSVQVPSSQNLKERKSSYK